MTQQNTNSPDGNWKESKAQIFWGEIAPSNHLLQIYESDEILLSTLEGFVAAGIKNNESVVIIATPEHLKALDHQLRESGLDPGALEKSNYYFPLNAHDSLAKFVVKNWPDEKLFMEFVESIILLAKGENNRRIRAYGEMVALLWEQGNNGATVCLEKLWSKFCSNESFCLLCAYPKSGFTQNVNDSIRQICSHHSKLIAGDLNTSSQIFYKNTPSL